MRVILVHNPTSGDDDHTGERLVELVRAAGHQVEYFRSKSSWQAALNDRPDLVAVAGGDGTVGKVARATAGRDIPITVLPVGTANNIACWLGLTGVPLDDLVREWAGGALQPFDVGIARGPWGTFRFLESVGIGLLAGMIAEIDQGAAGYVNELNGREARINAALDVLHRVLATSESVRCELRLDDQDLSGEYLMLEILNFGAAGPNLRLAPDADGADGRLDVVLIGVQERAWLEDHVSANGIDLRNPPAFRVHHARRVSIRCSGCMVHLDDELWQGDTDHRIVAEADVEPGAMTFLVPRLRERSPSAGHEVIREIAD